MTITIVVPIYNKAPFLERCFDSIKKQTVPFDEVVLIDDASTDGSRDMVMQFSNRATKIMHMWNQGVSASRNDGIRRAIGDYIVFLDADDALLPNASETMHEFAKRHLNIVQFAHERHYIDGHVIRQFFNQREWNVPNMPRYWQMAWNKMFNTDFIKQKGIKFDESMRFGEDEVFCADCIMANGGKLWHAPQMLVKHYFDDANSICRGGTLTKDDFRRLDNALLQRARNHAEYRGWLEQRVAQLHGTKMFNQNHVSQQGDGEHDVVYLLRDGVNEELRFSLRSVDENFPHRKVWFVGGCPDGLNPDEHMEVEQYGTTKFERVRNMLVDVCMNHEITEDFWLFNDDFFVMWQSCEKIPQSVNGTLEQRIHDIEMKENFGAPTTYSKKLRHLVQTLTKAGLPTLNYAVHKPILVNRKKALEVLEKFPNEPMFRALYGNYWHIEAVDESDCKVRRIDRRLKTNKMFISTSDDSFNHGMIGADLRRHFSNPSRFEVCDG